MFPSLEYLAFSLPDGRMRPCGGAIPSGQLGRVRRVVEAAADRVRPRVETRGRIRRVVEARDRVRPDVEPRGGVWPSVEAAGRVLPGVVQTAGGRIRPVVEAG